MVTDDAHIMEEISQLKENEYVFLRPEPAPKRIPDKVNNRIFSIFYLDDRFIRMGRVEFTSIGQ